VTDDLDYGWNKDFCWFVQQFLNEANNPKLSCWANRSRASGEVSRSTLRFFGWSKTQGPSTPPA